MIRQKKRKLAPAVLGKYSKHQMFHLAVLVNSFYLQFCTDSMILLLLLMPPANHSCNKSIWTHKPSNYLPSTFFELLISLIGTDRSLRISYSAKWNTNGVICTYSPHEGVHIIEFHQHTDGEMRLSRNLNIVWISLETEGNTEMQCKQISLQASRGSS